MTIVIMYVSYIKVSWEREIRILSKEKLNFLQYC